MKVFVNGCFDILHYGHLQLIKYAASAGDYLVIAIDSDDRIKNSKGINRPFNNQFIRKEFLESIKGVNKVFIFNNDSELENIIKLINPDIMIVGEEYKSKKVIGAEHAKKLKFYKKVGEFSTTKIINEGIANW
jgi:D-beta-D-heptose 7-phosphate kinase/D-beta-D-heptose 1-phosphate adenosyltransferase